MNIVLFEDDQVRQLHPATLARPAFAINCGGYRLIELVAELGHAITVHVREYLAAVVKEDFAQFFAGSGHPADNPESTLYVNSRLAPSVKSVEQLRSLLDSGRPGMVRTGSAVAAALVTREIAQGVLRSSASVSGTVERGAAVLPRPSASPIETLSQLDLPRLEADLPLLEYPHDIIRHHIAIFGDNLAHRLAKGGYTQLSDGVFSAPGAVLGPYLTTDTSHGPIILESGAKVGPYCYLSGSALLGAGARINEHAAIKDGVVLGHTTKVGGEVEASIIEPYTNKQHHGFLGHSYLGSWINLGAGTCNSDLKNTYGPVNMEYAGRKVPTGMQFVGAVMGDYAKTAINTGIFTGKTIGVCSMVYGFVTTNVPSFVNYARLFGQVTEAPVEVLVAAQRRMFDRRGVTQRPSDVQLLHDMYDLTSHERQLAGESLSLEPLSL